MSKFNTLTSAKSFRDFCKQHQLIILGDDNLFWVTSMRTGDKLIKQGYESAV